MAIAGLQTYRDMVRYLIDYLGGDLASEQNKRAARTAIQDAYSEFPAVRRWSFYYAPGRLNTVASQTTGTVAFDYTGGTYERMLTLSSATWPTWAPYGVVVISNVAYQVAAYKSSTILQLSVNSNPGADVASGTSYTLYRDTYPMPTDFISADQFVSGTNFQYPTYVHPGEWLGLQRLTKSPAIPRYYTFRGDPHYQGAMGVSFYPAPSSIIQYDFLYQRRPRPIIIDDYHTGTATGTSGSQVVTGSGTAWTSDMIGSALRFSATTAVPEGQTWSTPYVCERTIIDVTSATQLSVDTAMTTTYSGVAYVISDPVDIEQGAMMPAFRRCCEKQASITRIMKNQAAADKLYREALIMAMEADSRTFTTRVAGQGAVGRPRMAYMPADFG